MEQCDVWMICGKALGSGSGYSRRVLFELQLLKKWFGKPLLIYPSSINIPSEFMDYCIACPVKMNKKTLITGNINIELDKVKDRFGKPKVIYAQSLLYTNMAIKFKKRNNIPVFFDYHGVAPEEKILQGKSIKNLLQSLFYYYIQQRVSRKTDEIVVVSNNFKEKLRKGYKTTILPMLPADYFMNTVRNSDPPIEFLNTSSIVFCYLGQAQKYQMVEETLSTFQLIKKKFENSRLLIISNDLNEFQKKINMFNLDESSVKLVSISHKEVPNYLDFVDYGFVLRTDSIVNKVASPTKVLEYISRGVTPIMTEFVGDFPEFLNSNDRVVIPLDEIKNKSIKLPEFKKRTSRVNYSIYSKRLNDYAESLRKRLEFHLRE